MYKQLMLFITLLVLGGCNDNLSQKNRIELTATNDELITTWQENITISPLENDIFHTQPKIIITSQPKFGSIKINDDRLIYTPKSKTEISDTLEYKLTLGEDTSNQAKITLTLNNKIENFSIIEGDILEENQEININITTLLPVKEDTYFTLTRKIDEKDDDTFSIEDAFIPKGENSVNIKTSITAPDELKFNKNHIIRVKSNQLPDSNNKINYTYLSVASPDDMFLSIKGIWYNKASADLMLNQRGLVMSWMNYPVWNIPLKPTWAENPYNNNSWLLYYHSLYWLFAYEYAYNETNNSDYLKIIEDTILDYLQQSPRNNPKNYMSWDDHSVSWRTDVLSYFYTKYFKNLWNDTKKTLFLHALDIHADELRKLLDNPLFDKNNHGMFHALSLYNLTYAFPRRTYDTDYRERALERIYELFNNMVDTETGVSLEQSTHYQFVAIDLFLKAKKLIKNLSGVNDPYVNKSLTLMVDYSAHLIYPTGEAPTIGDSNYGHKNYVQTLSKYLENTGIESQYFNYVKSQGNSGAHLQKIFRSDKAGYTIIRPNNEGTWANQSILFADFGNKKYAHGHQDAMSFTLFSDGYKLLIDSGGPYVYLPPGRTYFWSKFAHNTLVINNEGNTLENATLIDSKCIENICYTIGQLIQNEQKHTRLILTFGKQKPNTYVFDYVEANKVNDYKLIYHFPTTAQLTSVNTEVKINYSATKSIKISTLSNSELSLDEYNGYKTDEYKQGWITPKYAKEKPAPAIEFTAKNQNFWVLTSIKQKTIELKTSVTNENGNFNIQIENSQILLDMASNDIPKIEITIN
jgi:hypothetical protein